MSALGPFLQPDLRVNASAPWDAHQLSISSRLKRFANDKSCLPARLEMYELSQERARAQARRA
jgi:hypothetical protein